MRGNKGGKGSNASEGSKGSKASERSKGSDASEVSKASKWNNGIMEGAKMDSHAPDEKTKLCQLKM